jgi:hypothetical protein
MSPSLVKNAVCEEELRINNANGIINQITLAVLSSSGETDDAVSFLYIKFPRIIYNDLVNKLVKQCQQKEIRQKASTIKYIFK